MSDEITEEALDEVLTLTTLKLHVPEWRMVESMIRRAYQLGVESGRSS